jgi:signal transduction histidine kinase
VSVAAQPTAARLDRRNQVVPWHGWTTRRWLGTGVAAASAVLLLLGTLAVWSLVRTATGTDAVVDRTSPALIEAVRLEAALVNQETGIRGYGLTGQRDFLQPYTQGLADEKTAIGELRPLIAGNPTEISQLNTVLARAATWQATVGEPIAAATAPPGAPIALATRLADEGKDRFDSIRAAAATEQAYLQTAREVARTNLRHIGVLGNWIFSAIAVVIVLLALLVFEGLRRGVTMPLERLSVDATQVAGGDLGHPIAATGPADMRWLAEDVEAMRQRLIGELDFSDRARRQLDEQAADLHRSNAELEQFAYVASHDLQEPLRKVASFCQLLQRRYAGQLDDRADQYIAFAVDGANRMQTLINDLLMFSRVGRAQVRYTAVDLEQVYAATVESLSLSLEETGARITHDPLPQVTGDATQLGMLVQNLLTNAVKFRDPARPPRIHLEARRDGDLWQFAVADNGIGIDPAYTERVFVIFQRLHTKEAYPGNGIGLAMCKKIVELHGGEIAIDTDHSPGTRITFSLSPFGPAAGRPGSAVEAGA